MHNEQLLKDELPFPLGILSTFPFHCWSVLRRSVRCPKETRRGEACGAERVPSVHPIVAEHEAKSGAGYSHFDQECGNQAGI